MTTFEPQLSRKSEPLVWRDKKRRLWLMGLIAPTALFVMLPPVSVPVKPALPICTVPPLMVVPAANALSFSMISVPVPLLLRLALESVLPVKS